MTPTAMLETTRKRPRRRRSIAGSAARVSAIGPSVFSCSICEATSDDVSSASECWLQPERIRIQKSRSGSPVLGRAFSCSICEAISDDVSECCLQSPGRRWCIERSAASAKQRPPTLPLRANAGCSLRVQVFWVMSWGRD